MKLKDRLKDMELRITELADYLQISRPTMYKFIDYYDEKQFELINKKVLKLFNYINENELAGKKNVINYILNHLVLVQQMVDSEENQVINKIKKYIINNPDSWKAKFITEIVNTDKYDKTIKDAIKLVDISNKRNKSEQEQQINQYYKEIKELLKGENK